MSIFSSIGAKLGMGAVGGIAVETAVNAGMTYSSYKQDREKGHNPVYSGVKAVASTILMNEFMAPVLVAQLAPLVPLVHQRMQNAMGNMQRQLTPFSQGFRDSEQAQTSRQRAMQAIEASRSSARNLLGNEAGIYSARYR